MACAFKSALFKPAPFMRALRLLPAFGAGLVALSSVPAQAHEPRLGPRGGALVDAGAYHVEVVSKDAVLDVFVSDINDKPLSATGFKGLAILAVAGKSLRVTLEPAGDGGKLSGAAPAALPARVKGAVQITGPDGKTATAKLN